GILVYSVDRATGTLTPVAGSPFPLGGAASGLAVDPAGRFLYVSNGASVTVYGIAATGALTRIPGPAFATVPSAFATIIDPAGKFLYITGPNVNAIGAFAIDASSGALTPIAGQPFPAGVAPQKGAAILLTPPIIPAILADSVLN